MIFFFSGKSESKTKKRKVVGSDSSKIMALDVDNSHDAKEDDDASKDDDVDPVAEGWEASTILGATDIQGQVHFLIQW